MTEVRREATSDDTYTCTPPNVDDVCIVHIDGLFPYDTYDEVLRLRGQLRKDGITFRECFEWELQSDMIMFEHPTLSEQVAFEISPFVDHLPVSVGRRWRIFRRH